MTGVPYIEDVVLLCKVGSIVVHADELTSPGGHSFDLVALENLLRDPQVVAWLAEMQRLALVPVARKPGVPE